MLSDEELAEAYRVGYHQITGTPAHANALRALEAAVRADQIETDAVLAETTLSEYWVSHSVAKCIRAQLAERPAPEVIPGTRAALDGLSIRTTERGK